MFPLSPHLTTTVLKDYLQQFFLPSTLLRDEENITYQKAKTQFEETEQAPEQAMAGMLALPGQEFQATTINMLGALMGPVDSV